MPDTFAAHRAVRAVVQARLGTHGTRQFPVVETQGYQVAAAMDTDSDQFSIDIGDPYNKLKLLRNRDVEVRVNLFAGIGTPTARPLFAGMADQVVFDSDDRVLSIVGRDLSCLAADADALPGKWRHIKPKQFITKRAHALGMNKLVIPSMSELTTLYTDGSEKEWAFWYRIARMKKMWMWTEPDGTLIIDKLNYALKPSYYFGYRTKGNAYRVSRVRIIRSNQGRVGEVWVYGEDEKATRAFASRGSDQHIRNWTRKPVRILTSDTARSTADAQREAKDEIFESIVGATEIEVTISDPGYLLKQNRMAHINLPDIDLKGTYFVVGVSTAGGAQGFEQVVRLREKGYALSRRVPEAPSLDLEKDRADTAVPASLGSALSGMPGIRWGDSFVRATREFGTPAGWDFAVFCGVLLAICDHESSFHNRRGIVTGAINEPEWYPRPAGGPESGGDAPLQRWRRAFANDRTNPLNPRGRSSNTAVGPMQLVSDHYRTWADEYGWNGRAKHDEYEGGRWNPDSNIRAAARALIEKLNVAPRANPLQANTIWLGVKRYYGSKSDADNEAYMRSVKKLYDQQYAASAQAAVQAAEQLPRGTGTSITVPGYGKLSLPKETPTVVKTAINFCLRRLGDPYQWGGSGPRYDCSSLVTAAYAAASPELRGALDEPRPGHHGETTYTLFRSGRFQNIPKDRLLPGDLVFFRGNPPEHMGMYLDDGLMVHAPRTGDVVKVSSINTDYYRGNWSGARRLYPWSLVGANRPG